MAVAGPAHTTWSPALWLPTQWTRRPGRISRSPSESSPRTCLGGAVRSGAILAWWKLRERLLDRREP